jgi:TPP-dependent pyruvate/acetoin dehydrogenase alpha subunit
MPDDHSRDEQLLGFLGRMLLIRNAETRLGALFKSGRIPGFIHLSIGQEAIAVGIAAALEIDDTVASTHRGHGHALAKGMTTDALFQEIVGNEKGPCKGRGGSLHVADFSVGMLGANGIVAAGVPIALGSAFAHKQLKSRRVAVSFFGDGALAEGVLYESLNLAKLWKLPLLFVCENNGWSEFSPSSTQYRGNLSALSSSFDIRFASVDGNDVEAVNVIAASILPMLRQGDGPAVIECVTHRVHGHYEGDPQAYRKGISEPETTDPIELVRARLVTLGVGRDRIAEVEAAAMREVDSAAESAAITAPTDVALRLGDVYA